MDEILKSKTGEEPSGYTNYVLVEQTTAGTYRANGTSNAGGAPDYSAPPEKKDLAEMLKVAVAWADSHGIHFARIQTIDGRRPYPTSVGARLRRQDEATIG